MILAAGISGAGESDPDLRRSTSVLSVGYRLVPQIGLLVFRTSLGAVQVRARLMAERVAAVTLETGNAGADILPHGEKEGYT